MLEIMGYDCWDAEGIVDLKPAEKGFKYNSEIVLECVRLASYLKGGANALREVVERSILMALPHSLVAGFVAAMQNNERQLPSPSLLRMSELCFDVALLTYERERSREIHGSRAIFSMSDSSPVANYDWLWSFQSEVLFSDLHRVFQSFLSVANFLETHCAEIRSEEMESGDMEEYDRLDAKAAW